MAKSGSKTTKPTKAASTTSLASVQKQLKDTKSDLRRAQEAEHALYARLYSAKKAERTVTAHKWSGLGIRFVQEIQTLQATGYTVQVVAEGDDLVVKGVRYVNA